MTEDRWGGGRERHAEPTATDSSPRAEIRRYEPSVCAPTARASQLQVESRSQTKPRLHAELPTLGGR